MKLFKDNLKLEIRAQKEGLEKEMKRIKGENKRREERERERERLT